MIQSMYVVLFVAVSALSAVSLMKYKFALPGSLVSAVLWFVWANASWSVEVVDGGVETFSYPTLAVIGYLAMLGMAASALIAGVEELTPEYGGPDSVIDYIDRRLNDV